MQMSDNLKAFTGERSKSYVRKPLKITDILGNPSLGIKNNGAKIMRFLNSITAEKLLSSV